jgi:hypothetical protein
MNRPAHPPLPQHFDAGNTNDVLPSGWTREWNPEHQLWCTSLSYSPRSSTDRVCCRLHRHPRSRPSCLSVDVPRSFLERRADDCRRPRPPRLLSASDSGDAPVQAGHAGRLAAVLAVREREDVRKWGVGVVAGVHGAFDSRDGWAGGEIMSGLRGMGAES